MSRKNNSYSAKLKYRAVEDYLRGEGSLRELCQKYGIRSTRQLRNWIKLYNGHKELKCYTGGSRMTKGRDTTYSGYGKVLLFDPAHPHGLCLAW